MNTVGLAMIVRDCEDTLRTCLESVKGLFDQVVIVDTGSVDSTPEIARKYGDVLLHPWQDDFSEARNFSFDQLNTDWGFWLDADDILLNRERFELMIQKAIDNQADALMLPYVYSLDAVGQQYLRDVIEPYVAQSLTISDEMWQTLKSRCDTYQFRERLIWMKSGVRWQYPVHEAFSMALFQKPSRWDGVRVVHRRHTRSKHAPSGRNLKILLNIPAQLRDERIEFQLGLELTHNSRVEDARQAFLRYLPLSTVPEEKYMAMHFLGDIALSQGDVQKSLEYNHQAIPIRPTWRMAYAGLLRASVRAENWEQAAFYGKQTKQAEIPDTAFAINPRNEAVAWRPDYVRSLVQLGRVAEALQEIEEGQQLDPDNADLKAMRETCASGMNIRRGQEAIAHAVEFFLRHDNAELAAIILGRLDEVTQDHPELRSLARVTNAVCGPAAAGQVIPDAIKGTYLEDDPRWAVIYDTLAQRPAIRSILNIGGPPGIDQAYARCGITGTVAWSVDPGGWGDGQYDAVMLWGVLERVQFPDRVVAEIRGSVRPGGWLFALSPNGPSNRGLAPPDPSRTRMRALSVDAFRQILGTVRMPQVTPPAEADSGDMFLMAQVPAAKRAPRTIAIVCPTAPELWGPQSLESGIGGSEEAVIRLSRAFSRRGHTVTVYGSGTVGRDVGFWGEVRYEPISAYAPSDILISWRHPEVFLGQVRPLEAGWKAVWLHDSVAKDLVAAAEPYVDLIWCISDYHATLYEGIPKLYRGRNGIDPHDMPGREEAGPKAVYVSSPFRGLDTLLELWPKIKAKVPDAEVHAYYGWQSAAAHLAVPEGAAFKARIEELCQQPGVVWHGRVGQPELYREMASARAWLYPTRWREEHCISAYLAQALGAWPVVYPLGALPQSVVFGSKVEGPETFVAAAAEALTSRGLEKERQIMMQWVRQHLSWDAVADEWERCWGGEPSW